ncbi:MAG: dihydropteroate synthase [Gammaproteobacteria bacterium]|jgi:dihydropteroate synthase|nr:dihydropteroate synthase [Gammaproteobacteria bacterium]
MAILKPGKTAIMGVLNVTPDSFSDGGQYLDIAAAVLRARAMVAQGADIIDIGGESTRPGASPVSADEECARVVPVIQAVVRELDVPVSVDTSKPEVITAAVQAGACLVNDVRALQEPGALEAVAATNAWVCLMHMQGKPRTMQSNPRYNAVLVEVRDFLSARVQACIDSGIGRERLIVDPGFGFGKKLEHNLELLANLGALRVLGLPILVGMSRKSMIGAVTGRDAGNRVHGSIAAAVIAAMQGVDIVRVHDVAGTADGLRICEAVKAHMHGDNKA